MFHRLLPDGIDPILIPTPAGDEPAVEGSVEAVVTLPAADEDLVDAGCPDGVEEPELGVGGLRHGFFPGRREPQLRSPGCSRT